MCVFVFLFVSFCFVFCFVLFVCLFVFLVFVCFFNIIFRERQFHNNVIEGSVIKVVDVRQGYQ